MRAYLAFAALMLLPAAAHADVVADARSATGACLSAVIDGAPVGDVTEGPIAIRRGADPVSCTVTISDGEPVVIRDAVMTAIRRRAETFAPAKTRWEAQAFASREAFCNLSPSRRNLNVVVSTGKPGLRPVLVATVFEGPKRDIRCDRDQGLQTVAESDTPAAAPVAATAAPVDEIDTLPAKRGDAKPAKKKGLRGMIPTIPGLGKHKD